MQTNQNNQQIPVQNGEVQQITELENENVEIKSKKNNIVKILMFVIIGLFLIILGGLIVWFYTDSQKKNEEAIIPSPTPIAVEKAIIPSPTPIAVIEPRDEADETAGWKTYRNDEFGFEFKYPEYEYGFQLYSLAQYEDESNMPITSAKMFEEYRNYSAPKNIFASRAKVTHGYGQMQIWVFENKEKLGIDDWYKKYEYYPLRISAGDSVFKVDIRPNKHVKIGNHDGFYNMVSTRGPYAIYIMRNDKMFLITLCLDSVNDPDDLSDIQILSTFKFIN